MMGLRFALTFLTGAALALATPASARQTDDEIRQVQAQQAATWNAHDARAYSELFADDADLVNVLGWWWKGRAEAEQKLTAAFSFVFAESHLQIDDVEVRPLADDLALAHVIWSMTGAKSPDGSGTRIPQHGVQTQVLKRNAGRWLIIAFQNTSAVPERPFPTGPVKAGSAEPNAAEQPRTRRCLVGTQNGDCLIYKGHNESKN